jgi:selenocysteine lyase/cysteine desulfurase
VTEGRSDEERVRALRDVLTATGAGIYLASHVAGPLPEETVRAVHDADELELRLGRVGPDRAEDLELREWEARAGVAAALRVGFEQVMLTHGAPEAARAIGLRVLALRTAGLPADDATHATSLPPEGDGPGATFPPPEHDAPRPTALAPEHDGPRSRSLPFQHDASRPATPPAGVPPRILVLEGVDPAVAAALESVTRVVGGSVDRLGRMPEIVSRDVAMVVMAHVDGLGRLADPRSVAGVAHRAGACLVLDVSLSVGALPFDVGELGADALIGNVQRWLLGPEGLAFAWLGPLLGADAATDLRAASGAFARGELLALARSVGWLLMYMDLPWVVERTGRLARRLYDGLAGIRGVELLPGRGRHGALLAFRIAGWDAMQAAEELSRSCHAILDVDEAADALRVSVGAWNRDDELERLTGRVAELARHTPESLPRRPSLTILGHLADDDR